MIEDNSHSNNVIEIFNLTYRYPDSGINILEEINLPVLQGSIWGLLGPNGAGKTTLIRCITGLLRPQSGEVRVFGSTPDRKTLKDIGVLIENAGIYKKMKGREYLEYFGELFEVKELTARINSLRDEFDIDIDSQVMGKLSLGKKQVMQIMRSLLASPRLIIWDEPYSNLDPTIQIKVQDIIQEYADKYSATVLVATHQLNLAEAVCDNILFLNEGKTLFYGTKNHLFHRDPFKCVSLEIEYEGGPLPLKEWENQFKLKIDYSLRPDYLDRRRIARGEPEAKKLYISGESLDKKISEVVSGVISHGVAIKSVIPEKKDLYNIYTELLEKSGESQ